jgi:hypothetical protein
MAPSIHTLSTNYVKTKSESRYDRRSVGQSVLVSSPICGPKPGFCYCHTVVVLSMWGTLSDERMGLSFLLYNLGPDPIENTVSSKSVLWNHMFVFIGHSLAMAVSSICHVTTHTYAYISDFSHMILHVPPIPFFAI